jgi:hypothetical protein
MANKKISQLTPVINSASTDLFEIETAAGSSRKVTRGQIINGFTFISALQVIGPATTQYIFPHGLGQVPTIFQVNLVNVVDDGLYTPGQEINILTLTDQYNVLWTCVVADNTNIYLNCRGGLDGNQDVTNIVGPISGGPYSINPPVYYQLRASAILLI